MKIVEKSPDHLILSNADSFWGKWVFVSAIIALLLAGVFIALKIIRPACWSGAAIGCLVLFLVIREIPKSFDMEFRFERENCVLKAIKHPWIGKSSIEQYAFRDVIEIRLVEMKHTRNYPGHDYIEDENIPIEPPAYEVELGMQSGDMLRINGAAHLAGVIAEFLGLPLMPLS